MRGVLFLVFSFMLIPVSAFSQRDSRDGSSAGITHGVSVSYQYLPLEFVQPQHYYPPKNKIIKEFDANGFGINYELSVPVFKTRIQLMSGLEFSYFLYKKDYDRHEQITTSDIFPYSTIIVVNEDNIDSCIYKQHAIEYMYLSVPVYIGYKVVDKKGLTVVPYMGINMKYNLSYIKKIKYDSFSYEDVYMNVFDEGYYKNDAARFIFQYRFGLELGYRHLYTTVGYAKDFSRLYDEVYFRPDSKRWVGYISPETMHNWQLGVGFRF